MSLERFKPAVRRRWLYAIAGSLWAAAGTVLCGIAVRWLATLALVRAILPAAAGLAVAVAAWRLKFRHLAAANIQRIERSPDRACLFSFQAWWAYILIGVMIALGALLRHSAIPHAWLAVLYLGIGGGLIGGSLHYVALLAGGAGSPPAA